MKNKLVKYIGLMASLMVAGQVLAEAPAKGPGGLVADVASVSATVEAIDYTTRQVTLKTSDGTTQTLHIGEQAINFNQVKKGDNVRIDYVEAIAVDVQKAEGELSKSAETVLDRAPKGSKPSGVLTQTVRLRAAVEAIDYVNRTVSLKGPEGRVVTLKVGDQAVRFNEVKKGDHVVVVYTEALGISVTKP